ncbi:hypothetical protein [Aliiglaciecola sp. LCG003]|uniref:hypothetical protein n=1 Tax=Aliiglaciecola sp. LCG003 TaxID=3053655 RepID=UPI002572FA02|nr:hypothetical protein [Aliiglaciecola sp. LCG003]WJG07610.1 hypothetical protein QR722_09530 [Aliiglaciecola sp. LCG003]
MTQKQCDILVDGSVVTVVFADFPIEIEESLALTISHDRKYAFEKAWLEGTNMFMGRTPLFVSNSQQQVKDVTHQAELFIGACSEPRMRWKLVIELYDVQTAQSHTLSVFFQTDYS